MKNLDKFYNKRDIPWVKLVWEKHYRNGRLPGTVKKRSFWWRDTLKTLGIFKNMAIVQVGNGQTCFFWKDKWATQTLEEQFPWALSFAKNKFISFKKAYEEESFIDFFNLPVSQLAFEQALEIQ